jgi:hypothetical protein
MEESRNLVQGILDLTGWTQARLVHELRQTAQSLREPEPAGLNLVTVNRWKQGRQCPSGYYRRLLRHLYAATYRSAMVKSDDTSFDEVDSTMKRRQFLTYTAVLAGAVALDPERLGAVIDPASGIDRRMLDGLTEVVHGYARQWYSMAPAVLLVPVRSQLAALNALRAVSQPPSVGVRLAGLAAYTAALAGWLSWMSSNHQAAAGYYAFAGGLAAEARDDSVRTFVLVARSFMCSDLFRAEKRGAQQALALLDEACDLAASGASHFLRVFALARRGEEHAASGASGAELAAQRDLDRAERALGMVSGPDHGFFGYMDAGRVAGCRGTCAMLFARPDEAVRLLSGVLSATPQALAGERSVLLTDLGASYAQQGEIERACGTLSYSLAVGGVGDANRVKRILSVRRSSLARWAGEPAVRHLDEELRAVQVSAAATPAGTIRGSLEVPAR